jgi:hypothetical protein
MPRVEFQPTTSVFERAKTVHALDRVAYDQRRTKSTQKKREIHINFNSSAVR